MEWENIIGENAKKKNDVYRKRVQVLDYIENEIVDNIVQDIKIVESTEGEMLNASVLETRLRILERVDRLRDGMCGPPLTPPEHEDD